MFDLQLIIPSPSRQTQALLVFSHSRFSFFFLLEGFAPASLKLQLPMPSGFICPNETQYSGFP